MNKPERIRIDQRFGYKSTSTNRLKLGENRLSLGTKRPRIPVDTYILLQDYKSPSSRKEELPFIH